MANALFDIPSPPSNTIILGGDRKGRVQFTVNNISGRPLRRVAARLTPIPDAAAAYGKWLTLAPSDFSEYGIAGSQQYTVQIAAPADAAAGSYSFRLDVWEDANPDDTLMSGPGVSFTVPAPEVKPKSAIPWWILVVAAAVIILIVGLVLISRTPASPPPVVATDTPTPTSTPTPTPSSTPTPTPTPVIGNFGGHWNLAGTSQSPGAVADLQQSGINVVGTFNNGTTTGAISGFVSGNTLSGQFRTSFGSGTFVWRLTSTNQQFQGTWSDTNEWCGWRDGSTQPVPCKPSRIIRISPDMQDKVLKITLVAPKP
ncbi:MAG: hypothetical protein M1434_01950 [Chloroflexi bacterium]|nr:hypothetical protein [Chloroflexota bacterium]MCL5273492.1 hypothetical protein [Chloroflexota bacterium]